MQTVSSSNWPPLVYADWQDTCDTLHMWTQIVGKVRLALAPPVNHWWHVTLYVSARGLTTTAIPCEEGSFEIEFDFIDHVLAIRTCTGETRTVRLEPKSVAAFYAELMAVLAEFRLPVSISTAPQEFTDPIPFDQDTTHASYEREPVE